LKWVNSVNQYWCQLSIALSVHF